jgi:outer membrane protein OmpA-like peptidoglycan-associated protein
MAPRRLPPGLFLGLFALAISAWPATFVPAETVDTVAAIVGQLKGLEAAPEIDVAQLRQQAADRVKARADAVALRRRPVAAQLLRLPHVDVDIQFNPDTPVIRPESYPLLGRIADALYDPALMSSAFLIVGRTESAGRRDYNLTLSQRRAEAIRDALVTTFKVSSKRLMVVGLGEEQLLDADHPKAAVNLQSGIVTVK